MKIRFFFFFLFAWITGFSQLETRHWFLDNAHISVAPGGITSGLPYPNPSQGPFNLSARTASLADANGDLLMVTNGGTILGRNQEIMPALNNVSLNGYGAKQMIQQIPGSNSRYLVFYCRPTGIPNFQNSTWALKYAIVDMTLNGGNGDVVSYNQPVDSILSASFTLVQTKDMSKVWLVTHRWATDSFFVYPITSAGVGTTPVISRAGTNSNLADYIIRDFKTSPDGTMIAGAVHRDYSNIFALTYGFVEVFNFNSATGTITPRVRSIRYPGYFVTFHSLEFSADNRLLYSSQSLGISGLQPCGYGSSGVVQYNLCYTDSLDFQKYSMYVATDFRFCYPQLIWGNISMGADKKIHMPYWGGTIPAINNPNRIGRSSNYEFNAFSLPAGTSLGQSTPDFQHRVMERAVKNNIVYRGGCHPAPQTFSVTNDTIAAIQWNFGDPASPSNTSNALSPSHVFSGPGIYTVTASLYTAQAQLIEVITELVEIKDPGLRLLHDWPPDTVLCQGEELRIGLSVVNGIFHWRGKYDDGTPIYDATADTFYINTPGTWIVEMRQNDCDGCIKIDSIHVAYLPRPFFNLGADRTLCTGDSVELSVNDPLNPDYLWSTGATTPSIWVHTGGIYWLEAEYNTNGCPMRDSIRITEVPGVNFALPRDTLLCTSQTLLLSPNVANATYSWQDGSGANSYLVNQPGQYWVRITNPNGCTASDTINVSYVNTQLVNLGRDTTLCQGNNIILNSGIANAQYLWSTGAVTPTITVSQAGQYWVRVSNGNCEVSDTINVNFDLPPVFSLGNDRTLCPGNTLTLSPAVSGAQYTWNTGSVLPQLTISQAGIYWVDVKAGSCIVRDSIQVLYYTIPPLNLGADSRFCTGDSLLLQAPSGFVTYNWSTGSTATSVYVKQAGSYWVEATTSDLCIARDTMQVLSLYPLPLPELGSDGSICIGKDRLLSPAGTYPQYVWSTGALTSSIRVNNPGLYTLQVTDQYGCHGRDSVRILSILPLPSGFLPADTAICSYGDLLLTATANYSQYNWSTGAITSGIRITQPGDYWLEVTDASQCTGRDSIRVVLKDCMEGLFVPSGFSPNNDGLNDKLIPMLFGQIDYFDFGIYNRWGELIFQSKTPGQGWNGLRNGLPQDTGVFVWICRYQLKGQPMKTARGSLLLIR